MNALFTHCAATARSLLITLLVVLASGCGNDLNATPALAGALQALRDCAVLLCARIGFEPWRPLEDAGIQPNSEHAMAPIIDALLAVYGEWRDGGRLDAAPDQARASA